jgi:hypothetical protein
VSHPIQTSSNFVQDISRRLHNDFNNKDPKKIQTSASTRPALSINQPESKPDDTNTLQANNISMPTCSLPPISQNSVHIEPDVLGHPVIIKEMREKRCILDTYKKSFGSNPNDSTVSKKKDKITKDPSLI